jgi:hypothetical protein
MQPQPQLQQQRAQQLLSRPNRDQLSSAVQQQAVQSQGAAHKRLLLDDDDPKMAAFDDIEVQVCNTFGRSEQANLCYASGGLGISTASCDAVAGLSAVHSVHVPAGLPVHGAVCSCSSFPTATCNSSAQQAGLLLSQRAVCSAPPLTSPCLTSPILIIS